jgi:hypothetical protein
MTRSKQALRGPGGAGYLEWSVVRRLRRARRPLVALVVLVLLLVIGYALRACDDGDAPADGRGAGVSVAVPHTEGRALRLALR